MDTDQPGRRPPGLRESEEHLEKLRSALRSSLEEDWANIIVLPEISVPSTSLVELMSLAREAVRARDESAGGCVICFPLELLPLARFEEILDEVIAEGDLKNGDISLVGQSRLSRLFSLPTPAERPTSFVNVAVLLAFNHSGEGAVGSYFFQPKRFPYSGERGCWQPAKVGHFRKGEIRGKWRRSGTPAAVGCSVCVGLRTGLSPPFS